MLSYMSETAIMTRSKNLMPIYDAENEMIDKLLAGLGAMNIRNL